MLEVQNINLLIAFAAGAISFLSPCCLPLVPGYLSTVSAGSQDGSPQVRTSRIALFLLGFMSLFVVLGLAASKLGTALQTNRPLLTLAAGVLVTSMGLLMLRPNGLSFSALSPVTARFSARLSHAGPLMTGAAFGVAWTPCIGPTLGAILTLAATRTSSTAGAMTLLGVYAIGLSLPFVVVGLSYRKLFERMRRAARYRRLVNAVGGFVLIAMGLLLISDRFYTLNILMQRAAASAGLDFWRLI